MNRRSFLAATDAAPIAATAALAQVPVAEDPHVEWFAQWRALAAEFTNIEAQWRAGDLSDKDFEEAADMRLHSRWELVKIAANTTATSIAGAAAMAEMLDLEFGMDAFGHGERCSEGQLLTNLVASLKAMALERV